MQHWAQTLEIHIVICASTPRAEAGGVKHPPPPVDLCQSTLWVHHSNEGSHRACTYTGTKPSERSLTSLCIRSRCSSPVVWLRESGLCNGKSIELVRTGVLVGRKSKYFQLNWFASFFLVFFFSSLMSWISTSTFPKNLSHNFLQIRKTFSLGPLKIVLLKRY